MIKKIIILIVLAVNPVVSDDAVSLRMDFPYKNQELNILAIELNARSKYVIEANKKIKEIIDNIKTQKGKSVALDSQIRQAITDGVNKLKDLKLSWDDITGAIVNYDKRTTNQVRESAQNQNSILIDKKIACIFIDYFINEGLIKQANKEDMLGAGISDGLDHTRQTLIKYFEQWREELINEQYDLEKTNYANYIKVQTSATDSTIKPQAYLKGIQRKFVFPDLIALKPNPDRNKRSYIYYVFVPELICDVFTTFVDYICYIPKHDHLSITIGGSVSGYQDGTGEAKMGATSFYSAEELKYPIAESFNYMVKINLPDDGDFEIDDQWNGEIIRVYLHAKSCKMVLSNLGNVSFDIELVTAKVSDYKKLKQTLDIQMKAREDLYLKRKAKKPEKQSNTDHRKRVI